MQVFANAALRAVNDARKLVGDIDRLRTGWADRWHVRRNTIAWRLLDLIARRPVLTPGAAPVELGIPVPDVRGPLRDLRAAGILQSKQEYRLGLVHRSDEILAVVEALVERATRS